VHMRPYIRLCPSDVCARAAEGAAAELPFSLRGPSQGSGRAARSVWQRRSSSPVSGCQIGLFAAAPSLPHPRLLRRRGTAGFTGGGGQNSHFATFRLSFSTHSRPVASRSTCATLLQRVTCLFRSFLQTTNGLIIRIIGTIHRSL